MNKNKRLRKYLDRNKKRQSDFLISDLKSYTDRWFADMERKYSEINESWNSYLIDRHLPKIINSESAVGDTVKLTLNYKDHFTIL